MTLIKFLIACFYPLALLAPSYPPHEVVAEPTDDERAEAGENAMWTVLGRMFE